jgi:hypothetical protein
VHAKGLPEPILTSLETPDGPRVLVSDGTIPGLQRQPGALTLSENDRRVLAVWAADCAERTLAVFEAHAPGDTRPRDAIDGLRALARGELGIGRVRALAAHAHAAAREVGDPAAVAAARAAGHAAAVAHMAAHARGAPAYPTVARRVVAPDEPSSVADEVRWAVSHTSPTVREVLRRSPPPSRPAGLLGAVISDPHTQLTGTNGVHPRLPGSPPHTPARSIAATPDTGLPTQIVIEGRTSAHGAAVKVGHAAEPASTQVAQAPVPSK